MLNAASPPDPGALFSAIDLSGCSTVVAAVSGGGDSIALLLLLDEYLQKIRGSPRLLAVTVDHGLRDGSDEEARTVGRLAVARGIAHRIRTWEGAKPTAGIAAAAREVRLALLAEAAREAGSDLVLTGHTADDQAETLAMRLVRGAGRGAAGIAPATLYDGRVWFVRPLLGTRREALRDYLRAHETPWVEDPTNSDRRFERARIRQDLDEKAIRQLLAKARERGSAREEAGGRAAALISRAAEKAAPGLLRLDLAHLNAADTETAVYALRILLAVAGGTPHLPDGARVAGLLARATVRTRFSLSRTVITRRGAYLYLHREHRDLPEVPLAKCLLWDGRCRIRATGRSEGLAIVPFGMEDARTADISRFDAPSGLVRAALAAEPAIRMEGTCLGLAAERAEAVVEPAAGPWARLLPSFDLAPARAVGELLKASSLPPPPWRGHKDGFR